MDITFDFGLAHKASCLPEFEDDISGSLRFLGDWRVRLDRSRWRARSQKNPACTIITESTSRKELTARLGLMLAFVYKREQMELQIAKEVAATLAFDVVLTTNVSPVGEPPETLRTKPYDDAPTVTAIMERIRMLFEESWMHWKGLGWRARGWELSIASSGYYVREHKQMRARKHAWWNARAQRLGRRLKKARLDQETTFECEAARKDAETLVFECILTAAIKDKGTVSLDKIGTIEHSHIVMEKEMEDSSFRVPVDGLVRLYKESELSVLWPASADSRFKDCLARDKNEYGDKEVRFKTLDCWETFAKIVEKIHPGPFIEKFIHHLVVAAAARFIVDDWKYRHARFLDDVGAAKGHQRHTEGLLKALAILRARVSAKFFKECKVEQEAVIRKKAGGNTLLAGKWARLAREAWSLVR